MKRLPLVVAIAAFPIAAFAAEPSALDVAAQTGEWVWCTRTAEESLAAAPLGHAELSISGTALSGRLFVGGKEYAKLEGVVRPASLNTVAGGASTRVWEISATETTGGNHTFSLSGAYTKYESTGSAAADKGSYEVLTLSAPGEEGAAVIISRVQSTSPLRFAAR